MKKIYFRLIVFLFSLFSISASYAADLRWGSVTDTETCTIGGYKIYFGTDPEALTLAEFIERDGDASSYSYNVDHLTPNLSTPYYFAVSAVSTENLEGPKSVPIPYENTAPMIVGDPSIDFTNNLIEITFSESNMQGAATASNYSFNQGILEPESIFRIDKTYQLSMGDLPEHAVITMTLNNITDGSGHALTSSTITINDNDNDNMADDWEADYGIILSSDDADGDGLTAIEEFTHGTNPIIGDSDNDGMDDGWEVDNELNPLLDDANIDSDGDGILNIDEYNGVTSLPNQSPQMPTLNLPTNDSIGVGLTPELKTNAYVDNENDAHARTLWQISTDQTFSNTEALAFELETYERLTALIVPEFILEPNQVYYWRVKFFDLAGDSSVWSTPYSFITIFTNIEDPDEDGVPNSQQVTDGTIDLDDDGSLDVSSVTYKMVNYEDKSLSMEAFDNVSAIDCLKSVHPDEILETAGKPSNLPFGLIRSKVRVYNEGDTAQIKIYFSESVGSKWYKYDLANGWTEYSADYPANVVLSADGKSVTLRLIDGGAGDSDGVANGIIVSASGPDMFVTTRPSNNKGKSDNSNKGSNKPRKK